MTDLAARLAELLIERGLPERKRDRKLRVIDNEIVAVTARLIAEHLQDRRDMESTLRPHTTAKLRAA